MTKTTAISEVNIHLRARAGDRDLIDRAADIIGTNRSQFMLSSALKEARNVVLDQTDIATSAANFQKVLAWLDSEPSQTEAEGLERLLTRKPAWSRE